ncbi:MAG: type II secretion system protein N [Proteobacteria bacterium]|nr:type II secretion system protein N [Pseudomonadota bacterium]
MRLRLLVTAILFFLLATAILWPAGSVGPWIESASNGKLRLVSAEGRLWNGSGVLQARTGDSSSWQSAQNIRWQLRWSELWRGRIGVEAGFEKGDALIQVGPDGFLIERCDATLSAALLGMLLPGAVGRYAWAGSLNARGSGFGYAWQGGIYQGEIDLFWNDAAVAEIPGGDLGDYRIRMVGEGQSLRFDLATLRGRLQIIGSGEISASALRFNGEAGATGPTGAQLNNLLRTLGRQGPTPDKVIIDYRITGLNG